MAKIVFENGVVAGSGAGVRSVLTADARAAEGMVVKSAAKDAAVAATKHGTQEILKTAGGVTLFALPLVTAAFSQHDHNEEKSNLAKRYKNEISALTGKPADKIKAEDVEKVARVNPAIHDAVHKSALKRNVSIVATVVATAAAAFVVPFILPHLGIAALAGGSFLPTAIASTLSFLGIEKGVEELGKKEYHLKEPSFEAVVKHPARQSELSVSNQISFLAQQQAHGQGVVSRQQVMTVLVSANPELDKAIKKLSGKTFAQLSEADKIGVFNQVGSKVDVDQLTKDINSHHVRVQELAFIAYGQNSGTPRYEAGGATREAQAKRALPVEQPDLNPDARGGHAARLEAELNVQSRAR